MKQWGKSILDFNIPQSKILFLPFISFIFSVHKKNLYFIQFNIICCIDPVKKKKKSNRVKTIYSVDTHPGESEELGIP